MKIISVRPAPPGTGRTVALFDIELDEHVRLYEMRLIQTSDGRHLSYAPNSHGTRVATFSPAFAEDITRAASAAYREGFAHDRSSQTA